MRARRIASTESRSAAFARAKHADVVPRRDRLAAGSRSPPTRRSERSAITWSSSTASTRPATRSVYGCTSSSYETGTRPVRLCSASEQVVRHRRAERRDAAAGEVGERAVAARVRRAHGEHLAELEVRQRDARGARAAPGGPPPPTARRRSRRAPPTARSTPTRPARSAARARARARSSPRSRRRSRAPAAGRAGRPRRTARPLRRRRPSGRARRIRWMRIVRTRPPAAPRPARRRHARGMRGIGRESGAARGGRGGWETGGMGIGGCGSADGTSYGARRRGQGGSCAWAAEQQP